MDDSTFDRIARALGADGTRRRLLGALTGLALGGALAVLQPDDAGAEKPKDRLQRRTRQRRRKRRNEKRRNQQTGGNGGGGGLGSDQCVATGGDCGQDSDCCTTNCFNFECATPVHQCSAGGTTTPCRPPAKGCAGDQCCRGALSCNDGCCDGTANQCNAEGNCCAPNCAGRTCGDDGCGAGGTCGTCPNGSTCNVATGQCAQPCDVCATCTYTTVQAAVADFSGPPTIRICPGIYNESITIRRPLTLIGAGQGSSAGDTILLGAGGSVVTNYANNGLVKLQNLRITGGDVGPQGAGGGVFQGDGELTMISCTVTGNSGQTGAGIYVANHALLNLEQCTISKNHADSDGGLGGGIFMGLGETTLSGCTVTENTAIGPTGTGAGIAMYGSGILSIDSTVITGNRATTDGGGIYNDGGLVDIDASSVTGNSPNNCSGSVPGCSN